MMELKWVLIFFASIIATGIAGDCITKYNRLQCVSSYSHSNMQPSDIQALCK